jgi:hypothetical protein
MKTCFIKIFSVILLFAGSFLFNLLSVAAQETKQTSSPEITQPSFDGGYLKLSIFLTENLKYPNDARKNNIYGTVIVGFFV